MYTYSIIAENVDWFCLTKEICSSPSTSQHQMNYWEKS